MNFVYLYKTCIKKKKGTDSPHVSIHKHMCATFSWTVIVFFFFLINIEPRPRLGGTRLDERSVNEGSYLNNAKIIWWKIAVNRIPPPSEIILNMAKFKGSTITNVHKTIQLKRISNENAPIILKVQHNWFFQEVGNLRWKKNSAVIYSILDRKTEILVIYMIYTIEITMDVV